MKIKDERKVLEKNFVKLWWMTQVDEAFRYARDLIRKKWYSLNNKVYAETVTRTQKLTDRELIIQSTIMLQTPYFFNDIERFAKKFGFKDFWYPFLTAYILTGKILSSIKPSKEVPSQNILDMRKIFLWRVKAWTQHKEAKKQGYKRFRSVDAKGKSMDTIDNLLGEPFIRDDSNIADLVFGEIELPTETEDTKRKNRVKTAMQRLKKELKPLSIQERKRLDKLFS